MCNTPVKTSSTAGIGWEVERPAVRFAGAQEGGSRDARRGIVPDASPSLSPGFGGGVVSGSGTSPKAPTGRLRRWLLAEVVEDVPGPEAKEG